MFSLVDGKLLNDRPLKAKNSQRWLSVSWKSVKSLDSTSDTNIGWFQEKRVHRKVDRDRECCFRSGGWLNVVSYIGLDLNNFFGDFVICSLT